jgi:hypothetical protein
MILTVHNAPPARCGPQSPETPVKTTNSLLVDVTVTAPLVICPLLVMVNRHMEYDPPMTQEPRDKVVVDAVRLAGVPGRQVPSPPSKKPSAQPDATQLPVPSS